MDRPDEHELTRAVIELATQYGRYGYRRITALLRNGGWQVGKDRVQQIWRREGLKVPQKQRPTRRLWWNDGSCVRLRPERPNQVWSYDFVSARTHDGRTLRLLTLLDEYTRECLALPVERRMGSRQVIETLSEVMVWRGIPEHIRSDNGPEFIAQELRQWLGNLGTGTLYIEPGSPWENGYCESFKGKLRVAGELLITPSKRAFWRNGSASLISRIAAIHSDRDARWRPGRPSLPLHRSCRGDREPFGWDRACSWNRTEVRNRRFPSCSAVGRGSIGR